ncbi:MAG: hypothetical protein Q4D77_02365 [Peptostreptococcaceae bacterium]|nr:hypothetical protein [Peptostreptococcaceae bacterium]
MKRMTIRLPEKLSEKLLKESKKQGFTKNALIIQILWEFLKKENK